MILDMVKHVDIQGHLEGFLTDISVIRWNFFKSFLLEISLISSYKIPPCLLSYLIRMLSNLSGKI